MPQRCIALYCITAISGVFELWIQVNYVGMQVCSNYHSAYLASKVHCFVLHYCISGVFELWIQVNYVCGYASLFKLSFCISCFKDTLLCTALLPNQECLCFEFRVNYVAMQLFKLSFCISCFKGIFIDSNWYEVICLPALVVLAHCLYKEVSLSVCTRFVWKTVRLANLGVWQ